MPDLILDGRRIAAEAGATVAAALADGGVVALRASVGGEPRGAFCAMGVCFECRVTIDGEPHRRACVETVREGMEVATGAGAIRPAPSAVRAAPEAFDADVAVVGGGPAGIAAACRAAESGASTILIDEGVAPGGQIYRHRPPQVPEGARRWIERLERSGARRLSGASVFDAVRVANGFRLAAEAGARAVTVTAQRVVLATGARELFLPFPGWTLPGVMGAGGAQALWKSGASFRGRSAVVAGSGPLLLPVAASLSKAGARIALVAEQAGAGELAGFAASLWRAPGKLREAAGYRSAFARAPYRAGWWIARALGSDRLEAVVATDGRRSREIACDLLAVGYGLVPNTELPRLLGCAMRRGTVVVDLHQQTSVPDVSCAGEPCGVAGVEVALAEGEIAGLSASGRRDRDAERRLARRRANGRRLASRMASAFRLRGELKALATAETTICRCEDVPRGAFEDCSSSREAKLATRAGMGPCQGRICGPALEFLFGWNSDTVRPPVRPARVGDLAAAGE
jgi:NADPH-dependent 2,4-dienoyl-CoA reductase/sulfur reductase-like enzyme